MKITLKRDIIENMKIWIKTSLVAVSQAPSPESNPNSPSPVNTIVGPYPTIES